MSVIRCSTDVENHQNQKPATIVILQNYRLVYTLKKTMDFVVFKLAEV